jgi:hypothetical protein
MARGIVLCTANHPVSLHPDGRSVGPREWAEDVDLDEATNAQHLSEGLLTKLDKVPVSAPRTESGEAPKPNTIAVGDSNAN